LHRDARSSFCSTPNGNSVRRCARVSNTRVGSIRYYRDVLRAWEHDRDCHVCVQVQKIHPRSDCWITSSSCLFRHILARDQCLLRPAIFESIDYRTTTKDNAEQCDGHEGLDRPCLTCVESTPRPRSSRSFVARDSVAQIQEFTYLPPRFASVRRTDQDVLDAFLI